MTYDPRCHHRRSIRLRDYDYAQAGAYFVTVCTQHRACILGQVVDGALGLNGPGRMVTEQWQALPSRFASVDLDACIVMPNHLHAIVVLTEPAPVGATLVVAQSKAMPGIGVDMPSQGAGGRAGTRPAPTGSDAGRAAAGAPALGEVVGAVKSITTHLYTQQVRAGVWPPYHGRLWQRNYYEHIIRNDDALRHLRRYIEDNPARWGLDPENPAAAS